MKNSNIFSVIQNEKVEIFTDDTLPPTFMCISRTFPGLSDIEVRQALRELVIKLVTSSIDDETAIEKLAVIFKLPVIDSPRSVEQMAALIQITIDRIGDAKIISL